MDGNQVNREVIIKVAKGQQELRQEMVFVGGATLSLYAVDPAVDAVRGLKPPVEVMFRHMRRER